LREIEQDSYLKPKVRLRAQVLRLSNRGSNIRAIASYTGRSRASIARDLDRWKRRGLEGLADGTAPGNPPRITEEARRYMEGRLTEERTWNATQLAEAPRRNSLLWSARRRCASICIRWAIRGSAPATCPTKHPTPTPSGKPERSWRLSKGGTKRPDRPEVPPRERLLSVFASHAHLHTQGASSPAPGEAAVGFGGAHQPHGHALCGGRRPGAVGVQDA
jgi:transposase